MKPLQQNMQRLSCFPSNHMITVSMQHTGQQTHIIIFIIDLSFFHVTRAQGDVSQPLYSAGLPTQVF